MESRPIGSLAVTVVGVGCNNFGGRVDAAGTAAVVNAALDAGVTFFDTADIYGGGRSEEFLGAALRGRRDEAVIATKFGHRNAGPDAGGRPDVVHRAAQASLRRLRIDQIDLYQMHQPDATVPIGETLGALRELIEAGLVREVGCSNFSVEQLVEAEEAGRRVGVRFVSVQNEYSLFHRTSQEGVLAHCERSGVAFVPYYPLASGLLSGKYRLGSPTPPGTRLAGGRYADLLNDRNLEAVERLTAFAQSHGHSLLHLAMAWLLSHRPIASVIAGATRAEQVAANAESSRWRLTVEQLAQFSAVLPAVPEP